MSCYGNNYLKTGAYGLAGNKGAVAIWFHIFHVKFLFINCHLCTGKGNSLYRNQDFDYINKTINRGIDHFEAVVWMGDFNYRIDDSLKNIKECIKDRNWEKLREHEQMIREKSKGELKAYKYQEGTWAFPPTYKFKENSDEHSDVGLNHTPAWTDRILYSGKYYSKSKLPSDLQNYYNENNNIKLIEYNSMQNISYSDHRPVYAYFEVNYN